MTKTLRKFDTAATLRDSEAMAEYMAAALETQDPSYVSHALGVVARAKGMSEIARASGLSREHLYRSFSENGNPTLKSMLAVMDALGVRLTATAVTSNATAPKKSANPAKTRVTRKKTAPRAKSKPAGRTNKKSAAA